MQFHWLAFLVLWTIISGPIFSRPNAHPAVAQKRDSIRKP